MWSEPTAADRCTRCDGVYVSRAVYTALCGSCIPRRFQQSGKPPFLTVSGKLARVTTGIAFEPADHDLEL